MFLNSVSFLATIALLHRVSGYATDLCGSDHLGVVGGHGIPIEDAPYMAALLMDWEGDDVYDCGATIIHSQFLLTSAYCAGPEKRNASVGSQRYNETKTNTIIQIDKLIPHKDFNRVTGDNDICLVKLTNPIPFTSTIKKITLADKDSKIDEGTPLNVTGWGVTNENSTDLPLDLQRATVPMISNKCCHNADKLVNDDQICAGVRGRGICFGDSGGPLTLNDVLVGIVSRASDGEGHCGDGIDVYTRVSMYRDWIDANIQNNL